MLFFSWSNRDGDTSVYKSWEELLTNEDWEYLSEADEGDIFEVGLLLPTEKEFIAEYEEHIFIAVRNKKGGEIEYFESDPVNDTQSIMEDLADPKEYDLVGRYYGVSFLIEDLGENAEAHVRKIKLKDRLNAIWKMIEQFQFNLLVAPSTTQIESTPVDEKEKADSSSEIITWKEPSFKDTDIHNIIGPKEWATKNTINRQIIQTEIVKVYPNVTDFQIVLKPNKNAFYHQKAFAKIQYPFISFNCANKDSNQMVTIEFERDKWGYLMHSTFIITPKGDFNIFYSKLLDYAQNIGMGTYTIKKVAGKIHFIAIITQTEITEESLLYPLTKYYYDVVFFQKRIPIPRKLGGRQKRLEVSSIKKSDQEDEEEEDEEGEYICFNCSKESVDLDELHTVDALIETLPENMAEVFSDNFVDVSGEDNEFHDEGTVNVCMDCFLDLVLQIGTGNYYTEKDSVLGKEMMQFLIDHKLGDKFSVEEVREILLFANYSPEITAQVQQLKDPTTSQLLAFVPSLATKTEGESDWITDLAAIDDPESMEMDGYIEGIMNEIDTGKLPIVAIIQYVTKNKNKPMINRVLRTIIRESWGLLPELQNPYMDAIFANVSDLNLLDTNTQEWLWAIAFACNLEGNAKYLKFLRQAKLSTHPSSAAWLMKELELGDEWTDMLKTAKTKRQKAKKIPKKK
jgi:hypothetical protein